MDYDQMYEELLKSGSVRRLSPEQVAFKEGDKVIGRFGGRTLVKSKKRQLPDFYIYTFDTRAGPINFPISQSFDRGVGAMLKVGGVYALINKGLRNISGGRRFKDVEVLVLEEPGVEGEEEAEAEENEEV